MTLTAATRAASSTDPLERLRATVALRRCCDELEAAAAVDAITGGSTWREVADALGVSHQAVHKKHRRRLT